MEGNASPFVEAEAGPCASTMNWSTLKQSILSDNGFSIGREREREREREKCMRAVQRRLMPRPD